MELRKKYSFGILLFFIILVKTSIQKKLTNNLRVTNLEMSYVNEKFVKIQNESFKLVNRTSHTYDVDVFINKNVSEFIIGFEVLKRINGVLKSFAVPKNTYFKYCRLRSGKEKSILFSLLDPYLRRYTTLNSTCPIGSHEFVRGLSIDGNYFPQRVPDGRYKVHYEFSELFPKSNHILKLFVVTASVIVDNAHELNDF